MKKLLSILLLLFLTSTSAMTQQPGGWVIPTGEYTIKPYAFDCTKFIIIFPDGRYYVNQCLPGQNFEPNLCLCMDASLAPCDRV